MEERVFNDERDVQIDCETDRAALDAALTGAEILAFICWRRKKPAWKGAVALLFFAIGGKLRAMGARYEENEEKIFRRVGLGAYGIGAAFFLSFLRHKRHE